MQARLVPCPVRGKKSPSQGSGSPGHLLPGEVAPEVLSVQPKSSFPEGP